jgi:ribonuclease HI
MIDSIYVHALETDQFVHWAWVAFDEQDEEIGQHTDRGLPDEKSGDACLRAADDALNWAKDRGEKVKWLFSDNRLIVHCMAGRATTRLLAGYLIVPIRALLAELNCTVRAIYPDGNRAEAVNQAALDEWYRSNEDYRRAQLRSDRQIVQEWLEQWQGVVRNWIAEIIVEFEDDIPDSQLQSAQAAITDLDRSTRDLLGIFHGLTDDQDRADY